MTVAENVCIHMKHHLTEQILKQKLNILIVG